MNTPAPDPTVDHDTLVIGAGAAGLAAGRLLAKAGRSTLLLEARDRIGGRIFTRHVIPGGGADPIPVELGAEFVHGMPAVTWSLLREGGLGTYELEGRPLRFADGRLGTGTPAESASDVLARMMSWLEAQPAGTDMAFDDYLRLAGTDAQQATMARSYVEGFNAADAARIGVAALTRQQHAEDAIEADRIFHVRGGYDRLTAYLAGSLQEAGARIALEHVVRRIEWRAGRVVVSGTAPGGAFEHRARRAVITLPLGVLQARKVAFAPAPHRVLELADSLAMGSVVRVSLLFTTKPWRAHGDLGFLFAPGEPVPTWWTPMPDPAALLTGWAGGPRAEALDRRLRESADAPELEEIALAELAKIFGSSTSALRAALVSAHRHDWQADEFALGAYSYAPAGALAASTRMTEPVADTLFFAGEHTDTEGHWGTVHAALASGVRAAGRILASP
ncbi:MAG TPA: NAD(P)/FAD-dependent oxidoreductase [Steroidobacteraceae bacterium]|nr:NAD(P)/FAD-dependent oxidoreductase [Steroidobacteraceae bacterium]